MSSSKSFDNSTTYTRLTGDYVDHEGNKISKEDGKVILKAIQHPGIGPVDDGLPLALRSTVDEPKKWYRSMFRQTHEMARRESEDLNNNQSGQNNGSYTNSSGETVRTHRIGSIFDYRPGNEYVVENNPIRQPVNERVHSNSSAAAAQRKAAFRTSSYTPIYCDFTDENGSPVGMRKGATRKTRPMSYHVPMKPLLTTTTTTTTSGSNQQQQPNGLANNRKLKKKHVVYVDPPPNKIRSFREPTADDSEVNWIEMFDNSFVYLPDQQKQSEEAVSNYIQQQLLLLQLQVAFCFLLHNFLSKSTLVPLLDAKLIPFALISSNALRRHRRHRRHRRDL